MLLHLPVKRDINRDPVTLPDEFLWQGGDNLGNSARFYEGNTLRRGKHYMHERLPFIGPDPFSYDAEEETPQLRSLPMSHDTSNAGA
jgi:hypothetical protein